MANDLAKTDENPMQTFQARVIDKIKTDIGSMLPDEVLQGLAGEAVQAMFFKPETVHNPRFTNYNDQPRTIERPSWFQAAMIEAVAPLLKQAVDAHVAANRETIDAAIAAALDADKLRTATLIAAGGYVSSGIAAGFQTAVTELVNSGALRRGY